MTSRNHLATCRVLWALGAAALGAVPAAATDWESVAGWDVYEVDKARCVVGRVFAEGPTTFGIILSLDGATRLFATGAGWNVRAGQAVPARLALDGQVLPTGSSVGIEQSRNRGFVVAAPAGFLDRLPAASLLAVSTGPAEPTHQLRLTGAAAGLAQGRRCLENLRDEARLRPAPLAAPAPRATPVAVAANGRATPTRVAARPATPRRPRSTWVTADDYPDAALRSEQEGSVTVRLAINASGEVAGCDVVRSSGSSALDSATCRIVQRRARYQPATDAAGRPVDASDNHTVRWVLPR